MGTEIKDGNGSEHKIFKLVDISTIVSQINSLLTVTQDSENTEDNIEGNGDNSSIQISISVNKETGVLDLFDQILKNKQKLYYGLFNHLEGINKNNIVSDISDEDFLKYLMIFLKTREDIKETEIQKLQNSYTEEKITRVIEGFSEQLTQILSPNNKDIIGEEVIVTIGENIENTKQSEIILEYLNKNPKQGKEILILINRCGIDKVSWLIDEVNINKLAELIDMVSDIDIVNLASLIDEVNDIVNLASLIDEVNDIVNLASLIDMVSHIDIVKLARLIDKVNDIDKLARLIDEVSDIDIVKLARLIDEVNYFYKLARLIDKVNDIDKLARLIDKVNDIDKLTMLINEVNYFYKLARLIDEVSDIVNLARLIDEVSDKLIFKINKHNLDKLVRNINKGTLPWF